MSFSPNGAAGPRRSTARVEIAKAAVETALARAQRELFGVVFWFVVLPGPCGPILYRLAAELETRWGRRHR